MRDKSVDYKKKYMDLRARFVGSMDMAFRLGYEKGQADSMQDQAQQQMMQAQQAQAQMAQAQGAMQGQGGAEQSEAPSQQEGGEQDLAQAAAQAGIPQDDQQSEGAESPEAQAAQGAQDNELDQYVSELESLVGKGEISSEDLKKSLDKIKMLQMNKQLSKNMKFTKKAAANLNPQAKRSVSMQERIVSDIMAKWEKESSKLVSETIQSIGSTETLSKKE